MDRHHLGYLHFIEKINCDYCGYANGLMAYGREIIARTEQYWCPIRHARRVAGSHQRYAEFLDYGDASEYGKWLEEFLPSTASLWADTPTFTSVYPLSIWKRPS